MNKISIDLKKGITNNKKVKELIVLLSDLSSNDENFGATKLNKLLFFIDFLSYVNSGKPISGRKYEAMPKGPMLKGFYELRDEMNGVDIELRPCDRGGYKQDKTIPLRKTDESVFSSKELETINRIVKEFRTLNAKEISNFSHEFLVWKLVDIGEEIPYEMALVSMRGLTPEEYEFPEKIDIRFENYGIDVESLGG